MRYKSQKWLQEKQRQNTINIYLRNYLSCKAHFLSTCSSRLLVKLSGQDPSPRVQQLFPFSLLRCRECNGQEERGGCIGLSLLFIISVALLKNISGRDQESMWQDIPCWFFSPHLLKLHLFLSLLDDFVYCLN